jgi:hypothetical protein
VAAVAYSLFPVLRGEGRGEGRGARDVVVPSDAPHRAVDKPNAERVERCSPLSPTLSPEYREEGV